MSVNTFITLAILLSTCLLPFIILSLYQNKRSNALLKSLTQIAAQAGCKISEHDLCGHYAIGIDEGSRTLFFFRKNATEEVAQIVSLKDVQSCHLVKTSRTAGHASIQMVSLKCQLYDKVCPPIELEFYNADTDMQLNGELQSAEKWMSRIKSALKASK